MRPVAVYSAMRIGLFLAAYGLLVVAGARGPFALVLATVVSLVLSYVLLRRQRDAVARALLARRDSSVGRERFSEFLRADAAAEDAAADRQRDA